MSDSERARSGVDGPVEISPRGPLGSDRVAFHAYSGGSAYQRVYKNILQRLVGTCEDQLLYWHWSGTVSESNNRVDRILVTENSSHFWADYIPTVADQIRRDLLNNDHVYYLNKFILNHFHIEVGFNKIRLRRTERGSLSFVIMDAKEFTYFWNTRIWETTLRNPNTHTVNPDGFQIAP